MNKKRVLMVSCYGLGNGGVQAVMMDIVEHVESADFDMLVFTGDRRHYDDAFESIAGHIYRIPHYEGSQRIRRRMDYYVRFLRILLKTYRILKKNGPYDVVHAHNQFESSIVLLAARLAGVKNRIVHTHTSMTPEHSNSLLGKWYRKFLQKGIMRNATKLLSVSETSAECIFGENHDTNKVEILPNSYDDSKFFIHEIPTDTLNIVHVGLYSDNKNQEFLIRMMPDLVSRDPRIRLRLIGFGNYQKKFRQLISELQMEKFIEMLPHDTDIPEELHKAQLFVLPSKKEGFGIVLLEAQATGTPCLVSTKVPQDADCGLCRYIELEQSSWIDAILETVENKKSFQLDEVKLDKFKKKHFIEKIESYYQM